MPSVCPAQACVHQPRVCPLAPALFSGYGDATSPAFSVQLLPSCLPQGIAPAMVCPFWHSLSTSWSYGLDSKARPQTLACQGDSVDSGDLGGNAANTPNTQA